MSEDDPLQWIEVEIRVASVLLGRISIPYTKDQAGQHLIEVDRHRLMNLAQDILLEQYRLKPREIVSIWDDGTGKPLDRSILIEKDETK